MSLVYELVQGSVSTDDKGVSTATRVFRVNTGNPALRPEFGLVGGPNRYDAYPSDSRLLAVSVNSVALAGQPGWFDVTYQYSSDALGSGTSDPDADPEDSDPSAQPDPTARTPTIRFSTNTRQVPLELDFDSPRKPVQNSAKQPFEGQVVDHATSVITLGFSRSSSCNVVNKQLTYVNTVNLAAYTVPMYSSSYGAGTLRCNSWNGTLQYEAGYGWYIACEVELEYRRPNWALRLHDRGYYFKNAPGNDYYGQEYVKPFKDMTTGQNLSAPRYLDGNGLPLPAGSDPVSLLFYPYEYVSWANLLT